MPPARKREPIVPQKVKDAFEYILATPGATLQSAAEHVGMVPRMLRFKMQRPESLRWMLAEKQNRLEIASAGSIGALLSIRDHGDNQMARVHAAKTIEQMLDLTAARTGIGRAPPAQRGPGLQIVVLPALPAAGQAALIAGTVMLAVTAAVPATSDMDDDDGA
jgi:hypothetical protein